jgi:hypothetical protein
LRNTATRLTSANSVAAPCNPTGHCAVVPIGCNFDHGLVAEFTRIAVNINGESFRLKDKRKAGLLAAPRAQAGRVLGL